MIVSVIAAVGRNGVIGREGRLPWALPADLKRFRDLTWGKPIIMGRKTHESLGRALPGRTNIVLTRQSDGQAPGCLVAQSPDEAIALADLHGVNEAFVIGGSDVFRAFLPRCDKIYLTMVDGEFDGDAFFPMEMLNSPEWEIVHEELCPADARNPFTSHYQVYQRRS